MGRRRQGQKSARPHHGPGRSLSAATLRAGVLPPVPRHLSPREGVNSLLAPLLLVLLYPAVACAASMTAGPGQNVSLSGNVVLSNADTVDLVGTAASPCVLQGNNFGFQTIDSTWSGHLVIKNCLIQNLGSAANHALQLTLENAAYLDIENTTWTSSSSVDLRTFGTSAVTFRQNVVSDNSVFPVTKEFSESRPFLNEIGTSTSQKFFQSNKIYKGGMYVASPNWLIGGDADSDGNLIIGLRARISATGSGCVIKHNYTHVLLPVDPVSTYWGQVANFSLGPGSLAENNVIRTAHWVARQIDGEFRSNLVTEVNGHNLVQAGSGKIHDNIFAHVFPGAARYGDTAPLAAISLISQVYATDAMQFYNNTLDARNVAGVGIEIEAGTLMPSLRNNVFYGFSTNRAIVAPGDTEALTTPLPSRSSGSQRTRRPLAAPHHRRDGLVFGRPSAKGQAIVALSRRRSRPPKHVL